MTSLSKNVCIDELDDIANKYNNTYHRTIKIKPVDVTSSISIDVNKENNKESPKVKIGHNVKISEYRNIFLEILFYFQTGLKKVLWLKKLKALCHGHMLLVLLTEKKSLKRFAKKNCKKKKKKQKRKIIKSLYTAQKTNFSIKDFVSKCDQIYSFLGFGLIYWRNF